MSYSFQDIEELEASCAKDRAPACFEAGRLRLAKEKMPRSRSLALLQKGCELGEKESCQLYEQVFKLETAGTVALALGLLAGLAIFGVSRRFARKTEATKPQGEKKS